MSRLLIFGYIPLATKLIKLSSFCSDCLVISKKTCIKTLLGIRVTVDYCSLPSVHPCDPSPCNEDEECREKQVQCPRAPCPPVAECRDSMLVLTTMVAYHN